MQTVNSVSGGKTSAFLAAHYPADYNIFALVRIEDRACAPKDKGLVRAVEDRIQGEFIATAEEDETLLAVLDLEQHIGQEIHWVTGPTFEQVIALHGEYLPNRVTRFCTRDMKVLPIFYFWQAHIGRPVIQRFGYRANEVNRASTMLDRLNQDGLMEIKAVVGRHNKGRHKGKDKYGLTAWYKPHFPLIEDRVFKDDIERYWEDKPVRFARLNNCAGCYFRAPVLLRKQFDHQPEKMDWFLRQEQGNRGRWRKDQSYQEIKDMALQLELEVFADLFAADLESCSSGFCGL